MPAPVRSPRPVAVKQAGRVLQTAARVVTVVVLVGAPLLWGGRHPLAAGMTGISAGVAALLWGLGVGLRGRWAPEPARGLWLLIPVLGMLFLQLSPTVFSWWPAPALADVWTRAAQIVDVGPARFAVRPESQWAGVWAVATSALLYFVAVEAFARRQRWLWLVGGVAAAGVVTAVLGLGQAFGRWEWFLWLYKGDEATASAGYLNRDHFAQLCALTVFVSLGLATAFFTAPRGSCLASLVTHRRLWGGLWAAGAVAALLAMIFSYSRAAILVTAAGLVLFTVGLLCGRRGRSVSLPLAAVGVALFIASFYGLDLLFERVAFVLSGTDPSALVRREIWATVLNVIKLSPWWGSGWEGVAALASSFDTSYIPGFFVNAAHNDYLELAVIIGVPLAVLVFVVGLWWYGRTAMQVAALGRRASSFFPVALGLFLGITVVLAQEAVEYGLKQPANLLLFVVACGTLGLVLKAASDTTTDPVRQPRLGLVGYGVLAVVMVAAVGMGLAGEKTYQEGWRQVELETVTQAARTNVALSERLVLEAQSEAAEALLAVNPRNAVALTAMTVVRQQDAEAQRRESWARALSALLERPVSPRQSERSVYAPYLGQALALIPEAERQSLAEGFGTVERAALALAQVSPSNASAVSTAATAADDRAFWLRAQKTAVAWHRYAVALAPTSVTVLARAVRGLALAAAGADDEDKTGLVRDFTMFAKRLAGEVPSDLTWILPLTETVGMTADEVASLVPERIQGQELFARWLVKKGDYESALSALDRAGVLNDARLEDEKPWTMGRTAYLAREKREKPEVALAVDQLRLSAYEGLGDETAAADVAERIRAREAVLHETVIARADALMADGDWVLADELLKSLKTDPQALVRRAEMALTMNRLEGAGQRMKEFEEVAELADDETRMRAAEVRERLERLRTVVVPESH